MNNITDRRTRQVETFDVRGEFLGGRTSMKSAPAGSPPRPHDAARRRGLRRRPAASSPEVAALRRSARSPGRSWTTNASRSRYVHPPTISQMVSGRAKRPASYGAGYERARRTAPGKMMSNVQPASRGQPHSPSDVVERVWWAARNLGVRSRRRRQLRGRAAHREPRGQPPKLAWTSASMSGGSVTIMVRFGPRPSALGARARFFGDDGALAGFIFKF